MSAFVITKRINQVDVPLVVLYIGLFFVYGVLVEELWVLWKINKAPNLS